MSAHQLRRLMSPRLLALLVVVAGLVAIAVATSGSGVANAATTCKKYDVIRTGTNPALAYFPPQVAAASGFMKRNCLKLEEQPVAGAAILFAQVQAGRADMALLNPAGIIQAVQSGIKLKIIAPNTGPGDFAFCVGKNSSIRSLKDFEGKSVATSLLGSNTDIAVRVLLQRAGVDLNKVKFVQILNASLFQSIANGTVDGGQCNETGLTQNLDKLRIIEQNPMAKVFGKTTPVTYAIVTEDWYNGHKGVVQRYQKAYLSGAALVARNPKAFRRYAHFFGNIPTSITDKMRLPALPLDYGYKELISQIKALVRFGAVKQSIPESQLKALFVPLPKVAATKKSTKK